MLDLRKKLWNLLRRQFLAGVIVIVPLILTVFVLKFLFGGVDNLFSPLVEKIFGTRIPGLGILATLVIIYLVGAMATNVIGSRLIRLWDILFAKTPLVRTVYGASKQLLEGLTLPGKKAFQQPVLVQYPRPGCYAIGFVANRLEVTLPDSKKEMVAVFVPSTPTPFTGFALLFPGEEIIPLNLSVEEALKFVVSGGFVSPQELLPYQAK
jgi:uncharacterized membrane protein